MIWGWLISHWALILLIHSYQLLSRPRMFHLLCCYQLDDNFTTPLSSQNTHNSLAKR